MEPFSYANQFREWLSQQNNGCGTFYHVSFILWKEAPIRLTHLAIFGGAVLFAEDVKLVKRRGMYTLKGRISTIGLIE